MARSPTWTFLSDHAHVLVLLAREPRSSVEDLAGASGIQPRDVDRILHDLQAEGYVRRTEQDGTTYTTIDRSKPLRHPVERHHPVGRLLEAVESPADVLRDRLATGG
jgi:DNA-binding IclR family transcriptional regulator